MLKEIQLTNFKSFASDAEPIPLAPVTILVGANASGKSNLLDALRFLQGIGMELSIPEILTGKWVAGRQVHPGLRGGPREACWNGGNEFAVRASMTIPVNASRRLAYDSPFASSEGDVVHHKITVRLFPELHVHRESIAIDSQEEVTLYEATSDDTAIQPARSLLDPADSEGDIFPDAVVVKQYSRCRFQELRPSDMKTYVPIDSPFLGEYGESLSAIVRRVCEHEGRKADFLEWLSALCAPVVEDIVFDQTQSGDVLVMFSEKGRARNISAKSISDGTLRFMGILAAMFTAPEGTLFLLEEIENGLHPTRVHLMAELLEQFAESRNLQIITTTHSSQVLLSLSKKALRDVILFARPEDHPGTVTARLGNLPYFEEVIQKTRIDELFTTGWMEFAL